MDVTTQTPAIEVDGLAFRYGRAGHRLADISLTVELGEVCALLGPNGAGKTTLLRCLLGLLRAEAGRIRVAGQDLARLSPRDRARLVAYVPQRGDMTFPFSALDVAVMGRTPHLPMTSTPSAGDRDSALDVLADLGIAQLADRQFSLLSGGERQLVLIARALVQEAQVLILDEPTAALDYGNEVRILAVVSGLAAQGRAVLMTTHQPDHALSYARRAVLLRSGRVVGDGPPGEVVTGPVLSELYGVPVHVGSLQLPGGASVRTCVPVPPEQDGAHPAAGPVAGPEPSNRTDQEGDTHVASRSRT